VAEPVPTHRARIRTLVFVFLVGLRLVLEDVLGRILDRLVFFLHRLDHRAVSVRPGFLLVRGD
jgi:hypothetical protein